MNKTNNIIEKIKIIQKELENIKDFDNDNIADKIFGNVKTELIKGFNLFSIFIILIPPLPSAK